MKKYKNEQKQKLDPQNKSNNNVLCADLEIHVNYYTNINC